MFVLSRRPGAFAVMTLAAVALAVAISAAIGVAGLPAGGGPLRVSLSGVPDQAFSDRSIVLQLPRPEDLPAMSMEDARSLAVKGPRPGAPDAIAREVVLVRFVAKWMQPPVDRLVWAVNLDPATLDFQLIGSGPMGGTSDQPAAAATTLGPIVPEYAVWFVDAQTGEPLWYVSAALQDGPAPPSGVPAVKP